MPTPHRALAIPEILHLIFSEFKPHRIPTHITSRELVPVRWDPPSNFSYGDQDTLAKLARSCKAFSQVALAILWNVQSSIVPLLSLLPFFNKRKGRYTLNSKISPGSWHRVERYAFFIRHLVLSHLRKPEFDEFCLVLLAQHLKDKALLPSLQTLSYPICGEIFLFLNPRLQSVTIQNDPVKGVKSVFLQSLLEKVPSLERISSDGPFSLASVIMLAQFPQLTRTKEITPGAFHSMIGLRHLVELHICVPTATMLLPPGNILPTLQILSLQGDTTMIQEFLGGLAKSPLRSLKVMFDAGDADIWENRWRFCLKMIARWSASLLCLELEEVEILQLGGLEQFRFKSNAVVELDDEWFYRMAKAWRRIEHLVFEFFHTFTEPSTTMASLESLATFCPNLQELGLRISFQPSKLEATPRLVLDHGLQRLYIDYPMSGDNGLVARHLVALFPQLQQVDGTDDKADDDDCESSSWGEWEEVDTMVKFCQATIQDERRRAVRD
ncbi:hypothetical protein H0H81_010310 [Sphagnurus paluster]|uniref:F-box domain-containing protein n=1 Tax=Sphagnurus paluster TaxID=117069 RepID=A0A9P7KJR5_9AGAR|nr:hypothetical protein H0H81_010310 [Sphagnurus paluster]